MAKHSSEIISRVDRTAAERLQEKLFAAAEAEAALYEAIESGNIPAALLSSTQAILRDAGLNPDLSDGDNSSGGGRLLKTVGTPPIDIHKSSSGEPGAFSYPSGRVFHRSFGLQMGAFAWKSSDTCSDPLSRMTAH